MLNTLESTKKGKKAIHYRQTAYGVNQVAVSRHWYKCEEHTLLNHEQPTHKEELFTCVLNNYNFYTKNNL